MAGIEPIAMYTWRLGQLSYGRHPAIGEIMCLHDEQTQSNPATIGERLVALEGG